MVYIETKKLLGLIAGCIIFIFMVAAYPLLTFGLIAGFLLGVMMYKKKPALIDRCFFRKNKKDLEIERLKAKIAELEGSKKQ